MENNKKQIFVDLDGTLIKTDLFLETSLNLIKSNPLQVFNLLLWLSRGRSYTKDQVTKKIDIDASRLPYQSPLIDYLNEKKDQGHPLILATASHKTYADKVAEHLGIFDQVIATDSENNMKGARKLQAIEKFAKGNDFAYAGDSTADRVIWDKAHSNIFVNAPSDLVEKASKEGKAEKIIDTRQSPKERAFLKEMRLHQWAKNMLIFVPLLTSHEYFQLGSIIYAIVAFFCFSLCASGVYFLNDLLDLEADRRHPTKRLRPLASGDLPIPLGILGALLFPLAAFLVATYYLPLIFVMVLGIYFLTTNLYSFFLKRVSTVDVMTLAILYTLRVVAGAAATGIILSSWLLAFSIFMFVSLAYLKRFIELFALENQEKKAEGRGYSWEDSETMFSLGIANITASVLVLALFINSEEIVSQYKSPELLWGLCLLMLYWGNRIWVGARRGKITEDPVVFAIKDRVSRIVGLGLILIVLAAHFIEI
ncbi:UbiA family prenyltransferase [Emcibacter sp.]|uniref:UbiA family prenyltransferase n=1 Tax=Emcibacter sp. TaxID=1979954 RepID=UPI002AA83D31|nr:UbiA family prenyltransferase [Emcibacter sp.]